MVQTRQNIRSTKPKPSSTSSIIEQANKSDQVPVDEKPSELPSDFPIKGHVMMGFHENLVGIGLICDAQYSVLFNDKLVTIISPTSIPVLKGWREATGNRMWCMSLLPNAEKVTTVEASPGVTTTTSKAYSAYDLPSVEALIRI